MDTTQYGPPAGDEDVEAYAEIIATCFPSATGVAGDWVRNGGEESCRLLHRGGRLAGGLKFVPMGQWFGGRSVPMTGIAGVGIAPEARGSGAASELMARAVREMHEQGVALSALFPSTRALYRRSGYEPAGLEWMVEIPLRELSARDRAAPVRAMTADDRPAIEALYAETARTWNGLLDRGAYCWGRVFKSPLGAVTGYVVEEDGRIDGYVLAIRRTEKDGKWVLDLTDMGARTARSGARLLAFLAAHATMQERVVWRGNPAHPLLHRMAEATFSARVRYVWMLRIVDLARALEARGYPDGFATEIHLDVQDELLPDNHGRFVLTVQDGRGVVERGGDGILRVPIHGLAPLYSGHLPAEAARAAGLLDGPAGHATRVTQAFAGSAPWMADMF